MFGKTLKYAWNESLIAVGPIQPIKPWDFALFSTQCHYLPEVVFSDSVAGTVSCNLALFESITSKLVFDFIQNKCITAQLL